MSERDQFTAGPRHGEAGESPADWRESTAPGLPAVGGAPVSGAGASAVGAGAAEGRSGTGAHGYAEESENYYTAPQYSTTPVTVRRPDPLAGLLLVLAGVAAAVSLLLDWVRGVTGWDLLEDGFEEFDAGSWQPPVIVLAGGVLLVLGLLMLLPGRGHRTLGVLALLVTLPALAGVVVLLNLAQFTADAFDLGFWIAAGVPALGLLGALKAMLTTPRTR